MKYKENKRNSAIELLRILAALAVVLIHYDDVSIGGGLKFVGEGSINQYYLYIVHNIVICSVNLFIMISAYFLSTNQKRRLIKVLDLLIQVIGFRIAFYILGLIQGNSFSLVLLLERLLPVNYFVILYSALYLVSPYINVIIKKISKEQFKKMLVLLILVFSVWTIAVDLLENILGCELKGLSTVGMYGSQYGFSIVNFILVYVVGAYLRLNNITLTKKKAGLGMAICFLVLYASSITEHLVGLEKTTTWNYNNPVIILLAAFVLLFFLNLHAESRFINEIAKAAFTCFLIHIGFFPYLRIQSFVTGNVCLLFLHQIGAAAGLYMISYVAYRLYHICCDWLIKRITPLCDRIDVSVEE